MNELKIFNNEAFGQIRTTEINNEPYFVGKDVASILGYANTRKALIDHIDEEDKDDVTIRDAIGRNQTMTAINESGLYSLILSSKMPSAKKFKRWVTNEVLPAIRKHGAYMTTQKLEEALLNPDTLIQLATTLKEEQEARRKAESTIEEQAPKVLFADAVSASHTSILIGDLAKILRQNGVDIGQNRLFELLRQDGFLIKGGSSRNLPTQKSMDLELFEIKERTINEPNGSIRITRTTKVTGKGQQYFINKFLKVS